MKLQLIRNATLKLSYGGLSFVIDPYLAEQHTLPSYAGIAQNPTAVLPCSPQEVIDDIDFALISHLHTDHFDSTAQALLSKITPIFCQPGDEATIEEMGFHNVFAVSKRRVWHNITMTRTPGQHGSSADILAQMGSVAGFILQADGEPTVYWAGDTVWTDEIGATIETWQPDIIVTHSAGAMWGEQRELILMDAAQTIAVCQAAPNSVVVATHMDAVDHATVSRAALRQAADAAGISATQLRIPADGEVLAF